MQYWQDNYLFEAHLINYTVLILEIPHQVALATKALVQLEALGNVDFLILLIPESM
jgi:hypothetical protein